MMTRPDKGEGVSGDIQSVMFQEYWDAMLEGVTGKNAVLSGGVVGVGSPTGMGVDVAKCGVLTNYALKSVAAAFKSISAADGSNPRIDLLVVDSSGVLQVRTGTAAAAPKPPARTANDVVLCEVLVPAGVTSILPTYLTDLRVQPPYPLVLYKTTAVETTNNTASAIHLLDKANSGITLPSGLLAAGRALRVRIFGDVLINSGTPTSTIAVTLGGTTLFSDVSAAGAADADRRAWSIDFIIVAHASNSQSTGGLICIQVQAATVTAPGTGIAGEIGGTTGATASIISPFAGIASSVDMDAANRVLAATWKFSVGNAANEVVTRGAIVELL